MPTELDNLRAQLTAEEAAAASDENLDASNDQKLTADKSTADDATPKPTDDAPVLAAPKPTDDAPVLAAPKPADDAPVLAAPKPADAPADAQDRPDFLPQYRAAPVPDIDARLAQMEEARATHLAALMEGELDPKEFAKRDAAITRERDVLLAQTLKAQIAQEQNLQTATQRWEWEVERFIAEVAEREGIDYKDSNRLNAAFDNALKTLAAEAANAQKSAQWFLQAAHAQVKASEDPGVQRSLAAYMGASETGKAIDSAQTKAKASATPPTRAPNLANIPPSLAQVPAAAGNMVQGEFSHLDKLSGLAYEKALAAMSEADRARYLESA